MNDVEQRTAHEIWIIGRDFQGAAVSDKLHLLQLRRHLGFPGTHRLKLGAQAVQLVAQLPPLGVRLLRETIRRVERRYEPLAL